MTANGSLNQIAWKVVHPSPVGNCTIRLGQGPDDKAFSLLKPTDKVTNKDGGFACGRESSKLDTVTVRVPNIACDSCTLQWEWATEHGKYYFCGDIQIDSKEGEACAGKCLNSGICYNGVCQCRQGFSGEFCQYKDVDDSRFLYQFMIFILLIAIIGALFYGAYRKFKMSVIYY